MSTDKRIRIELTKEQQEQVKEAAGQDVTALEFDAHEMEERIAPTSLSYGSVEWTYKPQ